MTKTFDFKTQDAYASNYSRYNEYAEVYFGEEYIGWCDVPTGKNPLQLAGVDGYAQTVTRPYSIDTKLDSYTSRNLFIEVLSNVEKKSWGWAVKPMCTDFFLYIFKNEDLGFFLSREKLQSWVKDNCEALKQKYEVKTIANRGYSSKGFLVPKQDIIKLFGESCRVQL